MPILIIIVTSAVGESEESCLAAITSLSREVLLTQAGANGLVTNLIFRTSRVTATDWKRSRKPSQLQCAVGRWVGNGEAEEQSWVPQASRLPWQKFETHNETLSAHTRVSSSNHNYSYNGGLVCLQLKKKKRKKQVCLQLKKKKRKKQEVKLWPSI